jgi:hypothetical protein
LNKYIFGFFALILTIVFIVFISGSIERAYELGKGNLFAIELEKHDEVTPQAYETVLQAAKFSAFSTGISFFSIYGLMLLLLSYICRIQFVTSRKILILAISLIVFGTISNVVAQFFYGRTMEESIYGSVGIGVLVSVLFCISFFLIRNTKKIISWKTLGDNSKDIKGNSELCETEKRILIFCSVIYVLLIMYIQKPWESRSFESRTTYEWDEFILWAVIPLTIFWGILWIRKWKKFW